MLCYIRNNIFKRLLQKCDRCRMSSAKYGFYYRSNYESGCIWKNLCADCVRELKKRDPITPEPKSLSVIAKQLEPKTITIF